VEKNILNDALTNLSPIQYKAATWSEGPLLVLAGPGSGKTQVLTCRIANLLSKSKGDNFRILALTFTNKAADEMRTRIMRMVPEEGGRLFIGTFHSFCADILRQQGVHLNINPNFQIYSHDNDLQAIFKDVIENVKIEFPNINNSHIRMLPIIQRLKSNLIDPANSAEVFNDRDLGKIVSLLYQAYEQELEKQNSLDFNSLILKTNLLFSQFPALAKRYRIVYPYICIDEFQDTNNAQYELIKSLAGEQNKNLFIVADDDQIIYQWNGASYKRIDEFKRDYLPEIIQLPINYRCPPQIVEMANKLIQHNVLRTQNKQPIAPYKTITDDESINFLGIYNDYEMEANGVAIDISKRIDKKPISIAVLARNRKLLFEVDKALKSKKIKSTIFQRKDEFESTPFIWLNSVLKLYNDRQNRSSLEAVCGSFLQLTKIDMDVNDIVIQAKAGNNDYLQCWVDSVRSFHSDSYSKTIEKVSEFLIEGRDYQRFINYSIEWFKELSIEFSQDIEEPNFEFFSQFDSELVVWNELTREIHASLGNSPSIGAFLQELQLHSKESLPGDDTVLLMTIHGSKGKEFEHVYLIGLVEDELPSYQSKQKGDNSPEMEEERRNCFVAITRAWKTLTLSCAKNYRGWNKKPSRFLYEMDLLEIGETLD